MDMRQLRFGIEIETVKITRGNAARAIQSVIGGNVRHVGTPACYDPWNATGTDGRIWKVMADSSLGGPVDERSEVVSPILTYEDIPRVQEIVRALRRAGAQVNSNCGIHIHVEAAPFGVKQLVNLSRIVFKQEELLIRALGISDNRLASYTRRTSKDFIAKLDAHKPGSMRELNSMWYGYFNNAPTHYDRTRYHILNLHSVFSGQTVEFRAFESTLHAGKIKSYIQLVLAIAAKALNAKSASGTQREFNPDSAKYDLRVFLLNLGFIGDEFKTARLHLLANMPGDSAWKTPGQRRVA